MASRMPLIKQITYMQMLYIKLLIRFTFMLLVIMASVPLCSANTRFIDQFQIAPIINEAIAGRITEYYSEDIPLPLEQQKIELLNLQSQLDNLASTHSDRAIYWFLKGLHQKNIASYYIEKNNVSLANNHMNNKNTAFKKALELSKLPDNQLSAAIFSTMKHGLPQDLKIEATKNELALGGNGESDSYYWYLHWSNIDQLEKAGRKEEAQAAYKKMQKELQRSDMDMSVYNSLTKKIETETLGKPAPKTPNTSPPPEKKVQAPEKKDSPKKYETKYIIILSVILLSVLVVIAVTIYELIQKRKKIVKRMTS